MQTNNQKKINPLARDFIVADENTSISVADIGCFNRPIYGFVENLKDEVDYLGVDEDPVALEYLESVGLAGTDAAGYNKGPSFDYTFGLEVIEHIPHEDSIGFLTSLRNKTNKAFFLTTPNFEGWDDKGFSQVSRRPDLAELRYIPDHLRSFNPKSSNPHHHKQIMTAQDVERQLAEVLSAEEWDWEVVKAWPWALTDLATGNVFIHYFKLHIFAWRRDAFDRDMKALVTAFCEKHAPPLENVIDVSSGTNAG